MKKLIEKSLQLCITRKNTHGATRVEQLQKYLCAASRHSTTEKNNMKHMKKVEEFAHKKMEMKKFSSLAPLLNF